MRFLSSDSLSPFERGGINAYAYCGGDPINRTDESGRFWIKFSTHLVFGSSAAAGVTNMVVSRMRARINNVELPSGAVEPDLPRLHPHVAAAANVLDTWAYTTSVSASPLLRTPSFLDLWQTFSRHSMGLIWGVQGADFYAALPMNARHEWRRAGVRGMPRGRLLRNAVLDAYGLSYMWQGVTYVGRAVGTVVAGVVGKIGAFIRRDRQHHDIEVGTYRSRD